LVMGLGIRLHINAMDEAKSFGWGSLHTAGERWRVVHKILDTRQDWYGVMRHSTAKPTFIPERGVALQRPRA
jgi:hypothetical protein